MALRLQLNILSMGRAIRVPVHCTGWRSLPGPLFEWPTNGVWKLEREGHAPVFIKHNEMLFVPGGMRHCLTMASMGTMHSTWLIFALESGLGSPLRLDPQSPPRLSNGFSNATRPLVERLLKVKRSEESLAARLQYETRRQALLHSFLDRFLSDYPGLFLPPRAGQDRLQPVFDFLRAHLHEPLSRAQLARLAHVSPTRFHYIFKAATGRSPAEYVLVERLRRAQELLITSALPVGTVAERCGFASPYYFSRAFKQELGMTPTEFRKTVEQTSS